MTIHSVAAELHADGRTDMKLIVDFRNFANVSKRGAAEWVEFIWLGIGTESGIL